jgi:hypothetical protein
MRRRNFISWSATRLRGRLRGARSRASGCGISACCVRFASERKAQSHSPTETLCAPPPDECVIVCSGFGSEGEIGHQLYNELGAGKLDSVYFQSVPTDEAKHAGYFLWRLDAALATLE